MKTIITLLHFTMMFNVNVNTVNAGYILGSGRLGQVAANAYCETQYSTKLASIHNDNENNAVVAICQTSGENECWIGRHCPCGCGSLDDGCWAWYDGTDTSYFKPEPGDESEANKGNIIDTTTSQWDDQHQDDLKPFVCNYVTSNPTPQPTSNPTSQPTNNPTVQPTNNPTRQPTNNPSPQPTDNPTVQPTDNPSTNPSMPPTDIPSSVPSNIPSIIPTTEPTLEPTMNPTNVPTEDPTKVPSEHPTDDPTQTPSETPSKTPTQKPTQTPSANPTHEPTQDAPAEDTTKSATESNTDVGRQGNDNQKSIFEEMWYFFAGIVLLLLLIICLLILCKRRKKKQDNKIEEDLELMRVTSVSVGTTGVQPVDTATDNTTNNNNNNINAEPDHDMNSDVMNNNNNDDMDPYSDSYALKIWLTNIDLLEYYDLFIAEGFGDKMAALNKLNSEDLKEMGITKIAHRKIILAQIESNLDQIAVINEGGLAQTDVNNDLQLNNINNMQDLDQSDDDENENLFIPVQTIQTAGMQHNDNDNNVNNDDNDDEYEYYDEEEEEDVEQYDNMYKKPAVPVTQY